MHYFQTNYFCIIVWFFFHERKKVRIKILRTIWKKKKKKKRNGKKKHYLLENQLWMRMEMLKNLKMKLNFCENINSKFESQASCMIRNYSLDNVDYFFFVQCWVYFDTLTYLPKEWKKFLNSWIREYKLPDKGALYFYPQ